MSGDTIIAPHLSWRPQINGNTYLAVSFAQHTHQIYAKSRNLGRYDFGSKVLPTWDLITWINHCHHALEAVYGWEWQQITSDAIHHTVGHGKLAGIWGVVLLCWGHEWHQCRLRWHLWLWWLNLGCQSSLIQCPTLPLKIKNKSKLHVHVPLKMPNDQANPIELQMEPHSLAHTIFTSVKHYNWFPISLKAMDLIVKNLLLLLLVYGQCACIIDQPW